MINLLRLARGSVGIWSQLRRLNRTLEWNLTHGFRVGTPWGLFTLEGSVPPSNKDIQSAEKEKYESIPVDEEKLAGENAIAILKARARGKEQDPDDPGSDWEIW